MTSTETRGREVCCSERRESRGWKHMTVWSCRLQPSVEAAGIEVLVNSGLFSDRYSESVHSEKCFYTYPAVLQWYWALFMIQFMLVQFICAFISSCSQH